VDFGQGVLQALFDWLGRDRSGSPLVECGRITGDGPVYHLLLEHVHEQHRGISLLEAHTRAFLRRGDGSLIEQLSGDKRRKLRRAEQRLAKVGAVGYAEAQNLAELETWLTDFLSLEASGWKGHAGTALSCRERDRQFFVEVVRAAFQQRRLMALRLTVAGRPVAQLCNFLVNEGSFAFKVAFDQSFARYSPGALLELENLRQVEARPGLHWMDSCTDAGDTLIKQLWSDRRIMQTLLIETGRAPGPLVLACLPLWRWLRRSVRTVLGLRNPASAGGRLQT